MNIDQPFRTQIEAMFRPLTRPGFPAPASLSKSLEKHIPKGTTKHADIGRTSMSHFGTAAVDIWLRSVHSFLASNSLTDVSPVWASVAGYYSSHYSVRGMAHLLGYFNLYRNKKLVRLAPDQGTYVCAFEKKDKLQNRGEHQLYWALVKSSSAFKGDPLFTINDPHVDVSDSAHRNRANYADHLQDYPTFSPLNEDALKQRIDRISKMSFTAPPIPDINKFPDLESVQILAYHRLVMFRRVLNDVLGGSNRFWNAHKNPAFARDYMNFQLPDDAVGIQT